MEQKNILKSILQAALYVSTFIVIQTTFQLLSILIYSFLKGISFSVIAAGLSNGKFSEVLIISNLLFSIAAILLFVKLKWTPISRTYLQSKPWGVFFWAAMLSIGFILPAEFIYERIQLEMSDNMVELFSGIMRQPLGYLILGILAPITEEIVFRGALLRVLLETFGHQKRWIAIVISALIFAVIHGNVAQGTHAFIGGIALGWLYMRTRSVLPGIVLHWVNNSIAYITFNLLPDMSDGKLIDFFHGDERMMYGGLFFSLCIFIPAIFQLSMRMKRADGNP
ncbi:CAAX amino terminal protease family protein [Prevotella disiens JCM 6334 = ATCC 29426]|uniref:CAAX prenyl protease-related protein n=3 Tax=Prevotella disiens TaxID=28130 RepID=A0A379E0T6_9BACT|nr:type II CAAX endopeptidase family protein [Prevotella disiens]ERJ76423.1 CAAX amino terminal protease family protein [Prevotella disiens JCM 6334 = ATCC 29426]SUB86328.1 CAAX prenyl protease-related protein [Prevotella disiens]